VCRTDPAAMQWSLDRLFPPNKLSDHTIVPHRTNTHTVATRHIVPTNLTATESPLDISDTNSYFLIFKTILRLVTKHAFKKINKKNPFRVLNIAFQKQKLKGVVYVEPNLKTYLEL
jgi:hypothetical protein